MLHFEGNVLHVYVDQAGYSTIGIGHLCSDREMSTGYFQGGGQAFRDSQGRWAITADQSRGIFQHDIAEKLDDVDKFVAVELTPNQRDALGLWNFNTGGLVGSTLLFKLNAGDYDAVPVEMLKWDHRRDPKTGQKVEDMGLLARRKAEAAVWLNGYAHPDSEAALKEAAGLAFAKQFTLAELLPYRGVLDTLPDGEEPEAGNG
jgi:GH24 family phage-related lysozyme (muramidase)